MSRHFNGTGIPQVPFAGEPITPAEEAALNEALEAAKEVLRLKHLDEKARQRPPVSTGQPKRTRAVFGAKVGAMEP